MELLKTGDTSAATSADGCGFVCACVQVWLKEADSRVSDHSTRRQSGGFTTQATTPGGSSSLKQLDNRSPASRER